MRRSIWIFIVFVLLVSCLDENPSPQTFLEYDLPFYHKMDNGKLNDLDAEIKRGTFGDIHSLLIIRDDKIVFENYYSNYQQSDFHPIGSSTQSVLTALLGTALREDAMLNINAKIIDLLPEHKQYFEDVPQKDQIEIKHLLSNTSGLWWDEWTHPFGSEDNDAYIMSLSEDWIATVLSTPMIREPGYEFNFNSGNGILMGPIMQSITGIELEQFAEEKLFGPLSIHDWKWERIPGDHVNASWGLHLRPQDMAKIGYLFLKNGIWKEQVIFDESWKNRSTRPRNTISNFFRYGYFWWSFSDYADIVRGLKRNDVFFAWGDGGQFIFVIPHLEMVIVSTAGNYSGNDMLTMNMLRDFIIEAVNDRY